MDKRGVKNFSILGLGTAVANEAIDIMNELEKQAREHSLANLKKGNKSLDPDVELIPHPDEGRTIEKAAELFNTNPKYIQEAKKIKKEDSETGLFI